MPLSVYNLNLCIKNVSKINVCLFPRFASFVAGTSHLSDEELLAYESEERRSFSEYYTDDSESGSES